MFITLPSKRKKAPYLEEQKSLGKYLKTIKSHK